MTSVKRFSSTRKRSALVDVARRHFFEHGYSTSNLDRIAADADISKVTIYSYFGSKEGLFLQVMDDVIERLSEPSSPPQVDDHEQLGAYLRLTADDLVATVTDPDVVGMRRVLIAEQPRHPALAQRWREATVDATISQLTQVMQSSDPQIDETSAEDLARQFLWMVIGDPLDASLMAGKAAPSVNRRHTEAAVRTTMATINSLGAA